MNITSFAIGALSIVGLIIVSLTILGVVKAYRAIKQITDVNFALETFRKDIETVQKADFSNLFQTIDRKSDELYRHMSTIERNVVESMLNENKATRSYVDSRIDKLEKPNTLKHKDVTSREALTQKVLIKD